MCQWSGLETWSTFIPSTWVFSVTSRGGGPRSPGAFPLLVKRWANREDVDIEDVFKQPGYLVGGLVWLWSVWPPDSCTLSGILLEFEEIQSSSIVTGGRPWFTWGVNWEFLRVFYQFTQVLPRRWIQSNFRNYPPLCFQFTPWVNWEITLKELFNISYRYFFEKTWWVLS